MTGFSTHSKLRSRSFGAIPLDRLRTLDTLENAGFPGSPQPAIEGLPRPEIGTTIREIIHDSGAHARRALLARARVALVCAGRAGW